MRHKIVLATLLLLMLAFYFCLPKPLFTSKYSTVVYDRNHQLLSARIADDGQWRFPGGSGVPKKFEASLLTFEDRYFYHHPGVNFVSILKAFYRNITTNHKKSGGSTITMQLARISRENPTRTYTEKVVEMIIALRIELAFSKKEILKFYANNAPFGGNVVGIEAAAWRYFGRSPEQLSWAESAMLAVLPNAPALIYPGKNHDLLLQKRNKLLNKLWRKQFIDKTTYELSLQESIPDRPRPLPQLAPHLLQRIINEQKQGNEYETTLIKSIQSDAAELLNKHLIQYQSNQINNAAALITDTYSGEILAYIGNAYAKNKLNQNDVDIIAAKRSSGSLLKPFLYGYMLSEGKITPHGLIEDIPTQIGSYAPKNFNLTYDGLVPASEALTRSLNVPAVKMLQQYGSSPFLFQLKKMGFESLDKSATHYGLSIILGGGEVSAWDVACAYASMGRIIDNFNRYQKHTSNSIFPIHYLKQKSALNKVLNRYEVISAGAIWHTFNAMNELARPEDYSKSNFFASTNRVAWKTGTSFGFRDAWAVGINKKYTIVIWIGNADGEGRPGLTGINVAAPLLFSMFNMLPSSAWYEQPKADLKQVKICRESGYVASTACINTVLQAIPKSMNSQPACTFHRMINLDSDLRYRVNSKCYPVTQMRQQSYLVMSPLQEYFYRKKHLDYMGLPSFSKSCADDSQTKNFDLVYPRNGFKIYLPVNENSSKNDLIMNATCSNASAVLFWYLDEQYLGVTNRFHQMSVRPSMGKHQLLITDEGGKMLSATFEIVDKKR
ncbi:MAG: penicillin-binding protein 1C [Bacteroidia bacterium]